jgi:site-specific DNA-methyltransferase (adenine-specific)
MTQALTIAPAPTIILAEEQRLSRLDEARRALVPATVDMPPEHILATLAQARQAIATVRSISEVKHIHDQAAALRHYTKKRDYALSVQNDAAEVTLRAFRRIGELLAEQVRPGNPQLSRERTIGLREVGISRNESSQSQQIAALPPEVFDTYITQTKERGRELTARGIYALAQHTAKAEMRRANVMAEQTPLHPGMVRLLHGSFQTCGQTIADGSVALMLTDPPYGDDWLPHMDALGALAARVLRPGGSLVMLYGQRNLRQALETLDRHLFYRWVLCYRLHGHGQAVWGNAVQNHWKPLLWYTKGRYTGGMIGDVVETGPVPEKDHHDWQQSESAFRLMIKRFTQPGDVILDPTCGSGTTAVAALQLRRRFVGCDCDAGALAQARARLAALGDGPVCEEPPPPTHAQIPLSDEEAQLLAAMAQTDGGLSADDAGTVLGLNRLLAAKVLHTLIDLRLVTKQDRRYHLRQKDSL